MVRIDDIRRGTPSAGNPAPSAFVTGTHVRYQRRDGRRVRGEVVGPDQNHFLSPDSVYVSFPQTGFIVLLPVAELEPVTPHAESSEP